jgi:hypothetical protein
MTLDISKIQYDKFEFKLSSNIDTANIVVNENVEAEKYNNDISINIDKEKMNLDKISYYYQVPENAQVDTKIEVLAQILIENEADSGENTATEEIQKTVVENKKIEVSIVEKKQENNQEKPNEQNNNSNMPNNEERNDNQKQDRKDVNIPDNEMKKSNEEFSTNANKSIQNGKIQSATFSINTVSIGNRALIQGETETAIYNGSNNNYLANIEIEGETLNTTFNKEKTTYLVKTTGKTELNINVSKEDENAKVYITGNTNLKTGDNKILISVTAENGDVRYYRVFVSNDVEK